MIIDYIDMIYDTDFPINLCRKCLLKMILFQIFDLLSSLKADKYSMDNEDDGTELQVSYTRTHIIMHYF